MNREGVSLYINYFVRHFAFFYPFHTKLLRFEFFSALMSVCLFHHHFKTVGWILTKLGTLTEQVISYISFRKTMWMGVLRGHETVFILIFARHHHHHHHRNVLPKGSSFATNAGAKAAVLPKAGHPTQIQEPRLQFYQG